MSAYNPKRFAEKLVWYRVENDLSQESLADIIGITIQTLRKWEAGKANTSRYNSKIEIFYILLVKQLEQKIRFLETIENEVTSEEIEDRRDKLTTTTENNDENRWANQSISIRDEMEKGIVSSANKILLSTKQSTGIYRLNLYKINRYSCHTSIDIGIGIGIGIDIDI